MGSPVGAAGLDYDVIIIGAGVIGCAVAAALAAYPLRVCLLDAADDVGEGTSKANTAILHTGFDATPGTLESSLVARGYRLLGEYADAAGIAVERTGALLVAWDAEQLEALPGLAAKAAKNGYTAIVPVTRDELYAAERSLGPGALGALRVPGESIICPWTTPLAFATQAVTAGVALRLGALVREVRRLDPGSSLLLASGETVTTAWVVNAAGLGSDAVNAMLGHHEFTIAPRRGELIVFDKLARSLVSHIVLPVPTSRGKGVLVAPTVFGNVLLGPTAQDIDDPRDTSTSADGIEFLLGHGRRILPALLDEEVTTMYAGVRAATEHSDYQVRVHPDQRYLCLGGIRSTGLTSSLAVAEHAVELLADAGLSLGQHRPLPVPVMPQLGDAGVRPYQRADLIAASPGYGDIVCHCERVSRQEVLDATSSVVPAVTLSGLRRRTRATMGRCQGFYCGAAVSALMASRPAAPDG
jgi:glycerol-3-phosphate dehydrogenase